MSSLSKESVSKLNKVIETCLLAGIENVLIENDPDGDEGQAVIRGINDDRTCLILSHAEVPELGGEGKVLGLSRMNILRSRVNVLNTDDSFEMSVETNNKNEVSVLGLKSSKAKTQFRCASPSIIKAPKAVNDEALAIIQISKGDVATINSAAKSMGAKTFTLMCKKNGDAYEAFIEYYDANQDVFSIKVNDNVEFLDEPATFVYYYITDVFLGLIRQINSGLGENETSFPIIVGKGGTLRLIINNHEIILVPQTNTQGD